MMSQIPRGLSMTNIETPHDHDVLCGRGGLIYKHVGNYTFRYLVLFNKNAYCSSRKADKIKIARSLVKAIRGQTPPGRFLKQDPETGLWHDIGDKRAIEKTSQALREGQRNIIKNGMARNHAAEEHEHMETENMSAAGSHATQINTNFSIPNSNEMLMQFNNENHMNDAANRLLLSSAGGQMMNTNLSNELPPHLLRSQNLAAACENMNTNSVNESLANKLKSFDEDELNQMICQTFLKEKGHLLQQNMHIPRLPSMNPVWNAGTGNEGLNNNQNNLEKGSNYFQGINTNVFEGTDNRDEGKKKRIRFANMMDSQNPKDNESNNNASMKSPFANANVQGLTSLPAPRTKPNWYAGRIA